MYYFSVASSTVFSFYLVNRFIDLKLENSGILEYLLHEKVYINERI